MCSDIFPATKSDMAVTYGPTAVLICVPTRVLPCVSTLVLQPRKDTGIQWHLAHILGILSSIYSDITLARRKLRFLMLKLMTTLSP